CFLQQEHRAVIVADGEPLTRAVDRIGSEIDQLARRPIDLRRHVVAPGTPAIIDASGSGGRGRIRSVPMAPRKYSTVRLTPSRSATRGSQPSMLRARVMSGRRTFGSSSG